jgi:hypothetical protein
VAHEEEGRTNQPLIGHQKASVRKYQALSFQAKGYHHNCVGLAPPPALANGARPLVVHEALDMILSASVYWSES